MNPRELTTYLIEMHSNASLIIVAFNTSLAATILSVFTTMLRTVVPSVDVVFKISLFSYRHG